MSLATRLILIAMIQTALLGGMIAKRQWTLNTGTAVVLETQPIDPRSLFRGDYVTFNYSISRLMLDTLDGDDDFKHNDKVYVVLEPGEPYWRPVAVYHKHPKLLSGQVALKGEVSYAFDSLWNPETKKSEPRKYIQVHYGIEDYYVPEGEGRKLERPNQNEVISLRIAVDRNGNGAIAALLVNGVERYRESLF